MRSARLVVAFAVGWVAASLGPASVQGAGAAPCRVRNVTQDTSGRSLIGMVGAAEDGDRLRVRGSCPGEVVIDVDIVIRGVDGARLAGRRQGRVVLVRTGARVTLRSLIVEGGGFARGGGAGIKNRGDLTIVDTVVRDNRAR